MSDDEGAARAPAVLIRQPTPLLDLVFARGNAEKEFTPPRGQEQEAPTTRAPLLPTPAVD